MDSFQFVFVLLAVFLVSSLGLSLVLASSGAWLALSVMSVQMGSAVLISRKVNLQGMV